MSKLCFSLSLLLLVSFGFAIQEGSKWQEGRCQISRIKAREPSYTVKAEGGVTEFWNYNKDEFECAGVSIRRHRIQPRGLLLPLYHNAPIVFFIAQGKGLYGVMSSGCPETFEYSQQAQEYSEERSQRFMDRHQKIEQCRQGDFVAVTPGAAHWVYNDGDEELVLVVFHHNSNEANQLDQNPRSFMLAGNPESQQQQQYGREQHMRGESQQQPQYGKEQRMRGAREFGNIFNGFTDEILAAVFGVDLETARKLRCQDDNRGHIVLVEDDLKVIKPTYRQEEQDRREYHRVQNGLDETICTAKTRENLDKPSRADIYNPRAGRFSTFNRNTLPILNYLQLSAARGVLYRNGIMSPHWYVNAHSIIYVTRGDARVQIVNHRGQAVFDGKIRQGQVLVVPHYFAVVKQAGNEGFEWVEFNTNENAMINTLSGRTSAMRALPVDLIAKAYRVSRAEAERLKFSRQETMLFSPSGSSGSERERVASA